MDIQIWETDGCKNSAEFYYEVENTYFCQNCNIYLSIEGETRRLGNLKVIRQLLSINKDYLNKIQGYINKKKLEVRWSTDLDQLKVFFEELAEVSEEVENYSKDGKAKDLYKIQERVLDLKSKITLSKTFSKYLFHKEMEKSRLKNIAKENEPLQLNFELNSDWAISEDENESSDSSIISGVDPSRYQDLIEINPTTNSELEDFKKKYFRRIDKILRKQEVDKATYEERIERLLEQMKEVEEELNKMKNKQKQKTSEKLSVSYEVLDQLYRQIISANNSFDPKSNITFNLNEVKWMNLLKTFSTIKLPPLRYYELNYIPEDSIEVKDFMRNSITNLDSYFFNLISNSQICINNYLECLKEIATKTTRTFCVCNSYITTNEFIEIVCSSKNTMNVHFRDDTIFLDEEFDFGNTMERWKIKYLGFFLSGESKRSDWVSHPNRFENLISAISRCLPLRKSWKVLGIGSCGISREFALSICSKFKLDDIEVIGG